MKAEGFSNDRQAKPIARWRRRRTATLLLDAPSNAPASRRCPLLSTPPRGADTHPLLLGPDRKLSRDHIACATRPRFLTINSPIESKSLSRNEKNQSQSRVVTGGVVSGLGKGVTASSIGVLLKACGHRVTSIKIGAVEERRVWRERRRKSRPPLPLVAAAVKQTASSPQKKPLALLQKKNSTKNRPVPQHRRRHDVPLRARRGVCTGRRRRGESLGVLIDRDGTEKREREKRRVSHPPSRPRPSSKIIIISKPK